MNRCCTSILLMLLIPAATRAIASDEGDAAALVERGNVLLEKKDYSQAIATFGKAIKLNPRTATGYYGRGVAYGQMGHYDKSIADLTFAVQFGRQEMLKLLGTQISGYNKAIRLNPTDASAYYNRGVAYALRGSDSSAISDFTDAIRLNPNNPAPYYSRG